MAGFPYRRSFMRDLAEYIARLNTQEQYHIGFCGTNALERLPLSGGILCVNIYNKKVESLSIL